MKKFSANANTLLLILILITIIVSTRSIDRKLKDLEVTTIQKTNDTYAMVSNELSHFFSRFNEEKEREASLFLAESSVVEYNALENEIVPVRFRAIPKQYDPSIDVNVVSTDGKYTADKLNYTQNGLEAVFNIPMDEQEIVPMVILKKGDISFNEVFTPIEIGLNLFVNVQSELTIRAKNNIVTIMGKVPYSFRTVYSTEGEATTLVRYPKSVALKVYKNNTLLSEKDLELEFDTSEVVYETYFYPSIPLMEIEATDQDAVKIDFVLLDNLGIQHVTELYNSHNVNP